MSSTLPELDLNYDRFLDKTSILYGETGTGKSFVMVAILAELKPHVDQIIVISPTDRQNHTYDKGIVPLPCIHYTISAQLLDDIWDRQEALASVYTKANNPKVLCALFGRIKNSHKACSIISDINSKLRTYEKEVREVDYNELSIRGKIEDMEKECKRLIIHIYKHYINENRRYLEELELCADELYSLRFLNLNPRMVIIFDDCTDLLRKFKTHRVMQKIFYQGRWALITALIACHTDKALDPELKKNAAVSMFTGEAAANAYFERPSNDLDKAAKTAARAAVRTAFTPLATYQKLAWVRTEKKFYRFTAIKHEDFKFGSPILWEYCRQIEAAAGTVSSDNKFIDSFL
jgi:hypothetical protein